MIEAQRIMIDRLGGGGTPPAFDELINELTAELEAAVRTIEAKGAEIDELEGDLHDTEAALPGPVHALAQALHDLQIQIIVRT